MVSHRRKPTDPAPDPTKPQRRTPVPAEATLPPDLLNAPQLARRLGIGKDKVYQMARAGQIPGAILIGSHWRFSAVKVDRWLHGETGDAA